MQGKRAIATLEEAKAFIRANTRIVQRPGLPIRIYQADELTPIWEATEKDLADANVAPPFWAFPWAGGQALSHYVLDNPETVRGKRVLDLASGSGLVAIAAAMAGAAEVVANDIDPMCEAAVALNAELNGVAITLSRRQSARRRSAGLRRDPRRRRLLRTDAPRRCSAPCWNARTPTARDLRGRSRPHLLPARRFQAGRRNTPSRPRPRSKTTRSRRRGCGRCEDALSTLHVSMKRTPTRST